MLTIVCSTVLMIMPLPGLPVTSQLRPSLTTIVGAIELSMRLPGAIALVVPVTRPALFGCPGRAVKSSISLFSRKPAPGTT